MAAAPLAGLGVMVTRPAAQADALCALLEARGASVARLPLLAIKPAADATVLRQRFDRFRRADAWLFTSSNAVRHARAQDTGAWPPVLYAVGAATAAALQALGLRARMPPSRYSSAGLLEHPALQSVAGQRFLIVTGSDGLDHLARGLAARGAEVGLAEVYRRVALPQSPAQVEAAVRAVDAIVITSGEALAQLCRVTPPALQESLRRKRLAVPSKRVVEQARALGFFAPPLVPDQVSDAAYLRCLEDWWTQPDPT